MRSHSVTCHPAEVTFPPLRQLKLVLDLATPEGCKAELTWGLQPVARLGNSDGTAAELVTLSSYVHSSIILLVIVAVFMIL